MKAPRYKGKDLIRRDLKDTSLKIKKPRRYSYIYKKRKQQLDYALVSNNLKKYIRNIYFTRIDYKFSDHAALIFDLEI